MSGIRHISTGSIARKLTVLVLASLLASFLVTAGVSTWLDMRRQASLETERLTQTARVIGSLASDAVAEADRAASFRAIRAVSQMPDIRYARLVSRQGQLLAETGSGARLLTDAEVDEGGSLSIFSLLSTATVQVTAPVMSEGEAVGSITLFSRTPELRARVLSTLWTTLAGALVAVAAGLLVALRMARAISTPIGALARLVRRITETGDFSARPEIPADGEIADLVSGIDAMLSGLRERDARIAAQVDGLESEVSARTAELQVARDVAEAANAAKSDFLAVMSHEIRTPLNGMLALSDLLATSDLPQRQQRYADVIAKSGKSLLSIINDILDFSKVEAGKMDLEEVEVDLVEAAEDVASLFSGKAVDKGLDLAVFVDPRLSRVMADPVRLRQVISNLVNNAIKFTEAGGVVISIRPDARDGGIVVAVEDTGPGIPADKLPALFDAFSQADQSTTRKYGGTGLGLAICDRLVRSMGGVWDLQSKVGHGSTFAFSVAFKPIPGGADGAVSPSGAVSLRGLPAQTEAALRMYANAWGLAVVDSDDAAIFAGSGGPVPRMGALVCESEAAAFDMARQEPDACLLVRPLRQADIRDVVLQVDAGRRPVASRLIQRAAAGTSFPGVRVLVVDDSDVNREVAIEALSRLGVQTSTANDGREALELLREQTYDLVLMDGSMPVLDGFEATRLIRAEEAAADRPRATIVALTAHVVGSGADAWKHCGMDGIVHKPFTLEDLVRVLTQFCGARAVVGPDPVSLGGGNDTTDDDGSLFDASTRAELLAMEKGGRQDFVDRVHGLYAANAPLRLCEIVDGAAAGDADAVARAAHALKSMSLSLGAAGVAREATRLETAARSGADLATLTLAEISSLVDRTLEAMARPREGAPKSLADEMRNGLQRGDLRMVYQPLADRSGALSSKVEALVRWDHPERGALSPGEFIPQLETEGAIADLTDFVLRRAMNDLIDRADVHVSVNCSASEFQQPGFAERVRSAAASVSFPAHRLEIEVTETAILDVPAACRTIDALREAGFAVALDDFGAGYTSLHALRELKFTTLKVDRSFVERCASDTASAAIIHAVIGVGRALGMKVVCEGVETAEQADFLRIAGAHYLQGYYFHLPVGLHELPRAVEHAA